MNTLMTAKILYIDHHEDITYDELRSRGFSTKETFEILKYLSLFRVAGEYHKYLVSVFDENTKVYDSYVVETTESRVRIIIEARCELYNIRYTNMIIEKVGDFEKL